AAGRAERRTTITLKKDSDGTPYYETEEEILSPPPPNAMPAGAPRGAFIPILGTGIGLALRGHWSELFQLLNPASMLIAVQAGPLVQAAPGPRPGRREKRSLQWDLMSRYEAD